MQAQLAGPAHDGLRREMRRLQEDVARLRGDTRGVAAHDAGHSQRLFLVRHQQHVVVQADGVAVEQQQRLTGARLPQHDVAVQGVVVERMHRLAQLQHHIVGRVDHGIDRAHPAAAQALGQPQRRARRHVDTLEHATEVARRGALRLQPHAAPDLAGHGDRSLRRQGHVAAHQRGNVIGHAVEAEAIGAVGGQAELDAGIRQAKVFGQRLANRRIVRQLEQAGSIVVQAQLLRRAQHAERFHAA